jgi:hypothetical protein
VGGIARRKPVEPFRVTYSELTRHIGEPQTTGVKIDDPQTLVTFFRWACGCRAYEWPDHVEIQPCPQHRDILRERS